MIIDEKFVNKFMKTESGLNNADSRKMAILSISFIHCDDSWPTFETIISKIYHYQEIGIRTKVTNRNKRSKGIRYENSRIV